MWQLSFFFLVVPALVQTYEPMEDPNLFEGDMILSPDQLEEIRNGKINRAVPMAATKTNLWPRKIPFDYHELKWTSGRASIDTAFKAFEKHTCLRFVRRTTEKGYLKFYNNGCSTQVGYTQGPRRVNLGKECWENHIATHEIMHALGFYHEQSRPDRDQFVKIRYENILKGLERQFEKRGSNVIDSLGVPYDYKSIMHYRKTAFSKNRGITVETLDPTKQDVIGEQKALSKSDIKQINLLYKCNEPEVTPSPSQKPTPDSQCTDVYDRCNSHKHKCSSPKDDTWFKWVAENCKRTCGFCSGPPSPQDTIQAGSSECKDKLVNCDAFSKYCLSSESSWKNFLKTNCPQTCGYCGPVTKTTANPNCYDLADCTGYVARGYCSPKAIPHFHRYMKKNCIKSCGWCVKATALPPVGTVPPWPKECGVPSFQTSKVIGGVDAKPGAWPWQARLYKTNTKTSYCGASLISTNWLVTAAHCVKGKSALEITVHLGVHSLAKNEKSLQKIPVRQVIIHHSYGRPSRMNNDIALLQLVRPAILNDRVKSVCLPKQDDSVKVGTKCYITGWGKTKHPGTGSIILQQSDLDIVDNGICHALNYGNYRIRVTKGMVCAGLGKGTIQGGCHGDSGGPLVCKQNGKFVLHGDVSWGSHTCDTSKGYTVFGRVSHYRTWMDQYIYT
ncbi:zinc metalloproteinase nas-15-like isoform X2 [Hydractinia symbiolongicarpus]|uniref:zinc metalloproteinase nas-15-like isoform X2 n=1 Tax=Hydractinia symbiolongicarpus TaxID=13093 RepID=UPI00254A9516|nr:zinc metalloproteinase nas-15-like isoform X2 [Hydractinia symbiolongicarpus]